MTLKTRQPPAHPAPELDPARAMTPAWDELRANLIEQLRAHALIMDSVTLSSGKQAEYYIDAKRLALSASGFTLIGKMVSGEARSVGATAVGGLTIGADPIACAALSAQAAPKAFLVRKEQKEHGLQRWIEGPLLDPAVERCLIVDDVVTTGSSTVQAIERVRGAGLTVVGVVSVLDRQDGGRKAIEAAAGAPYTPLTTIDDVYPERPDR